MRRGERVLVRAYPDETLERVVWAEYETYIVVCRPEVYSNAVLFDTEPEAVMGFPREDVRGFGTGA